MARPLDKQSFFTVDHDQADASGQDRTQVETKAEEGQESFRPEGFRLMRA